MAEDKDKDIFNLEGDELDAALMAAIEETDEEEREAREQRAKLNQERAEQARITALEEEQKKARIEELKASLPNEGRRYFVMADESSVDEEANEAFITGMVFGKCKKDDTAFIYRNDGKAVSTKVLSIESFNGQLYEPASEVSQNKARIKVELDIKTLGLNADNAIPKFSVLTTVPPKMQDRNGKTAVENPALSGLLFRYPEYNKDKQYLNHLMNNIVNGRFLVPAMKDGEGKDGKPKLKIIMVMPSKDSDKRALPLFTDLQAVLLWKKLFEGQKPSIIAMTFPEAAKFVEKDGFDVVLNPSGPVAVRLPGNVVTTMAATVRKIVTEQKLKKEVVNDGSKVTIGELRPGEESDRLRTALTDYCKHNKDIKKAGILYLVRNGKFSYLVIVDAPKSSQQPVFSGILAALKPHLTGNIKTVDFSLLSEAPFANDYYSRREWDYKR